MAPRRMCSCESLRRHVSLGSRIDDESQSGSALQHRSNRDAADGWHVVLWDRASNPGKLHRLASNSPGSKPDTQLIRSGSGQILSSQPAIRAGSIGSCTTLSLSPDWSLLLASRQDVRVATLRCLTVDVRVTGPVGTPLRMSWKGAALRTSVRETRIGLEDIPDESSRALD